MATPSDKQSNDLWTDFQDEEGMKPVTDKTDGSQWTGKFDRRKTPRDEEGNTSPSGDDSSS